MLRMEMPIVEYDRKVGKLMQKRTGEPLFNGTLEHAVVILTRLLKSAEKSICILTGELNRDAYGRDQVLQAAKDFLRHENSERRIQVLVEDASLRSAEEVSKHPFLQAISQSSPQAECRIVPKDKQGLYDFHFIVMDEDSYRFEPDKSKFGAVAAFGDRDNALHLKALFEQLWNDSQGEKIDLQHHALAH